MCVCVCVLTLLNFYPIFFFFFLEKSIILKNFSQPAADQSVSAPTPVCRSSARDTHHIVLNHYAVPYSCQCADATTTRPALCWQEEEKRTKCILFLSPQRTSFQDELLWLWIPLSTPPPPILSPPPPPPALSGGKSTDFLCLNGLAKDILIIIFFFMRKREKKIHFTLLCAWFVQPLQNGSSVIVLCSWAMIWILCRPEWEKMILSGLSVCVRSETRDFKASSVFMWMTGVAMLPLLLLFKPGGERNTRYFCDRVRYSLFLVFKKKKQSNHQTTNQFSPARVCVLWECLNVYISFLLKKMFLIRH